MNPLERTLDNDKTHFAVLALCLVPDHEGAVDLAVGVCGVAEVGRRLDAFDELAVPADLEDAELVRQVDRLFRTAGALDVAGLDEAVQFVRDGVDGRDFDVVRARAERSGREHEKRKCLFAHGESVPQFRRVC